MPRVMLRHMYTHRYRVALSGCLLLFVHNVLADIGATHPCEDPRSTSPEECAGSPMPNHPEPVRGVKPLPTGDQLAAMKPVAIAAGARFSLAVAEDGTVWTWGHGQMTPVQVSGLSDVISVAAGDGFALALLADKTVRARGNNFDGQLGDSSFFDSPTPVTVVACADVDSGLGVSCADPRNGVTTEVLGNIYAIAAGSRHALALQANARVWAWGSNLFGQLGIGDSPFAQAQAMPFAVPVGTAFRDIAAGQYHSLAVSHGDRVFAWGANLDGHLGDGTYEQRSTPVLVFVPGLNRTATVAGGAGHSVANGAHELSDAENGELTAHAWGANDHGQLGDGQSPSQHHIVPELVGPAGAPLGYVKDLAAGGGGHTLALLRDGTVRAWGRNSDGQLGDGNNTPAQNLPVDVQGLAPLKLPLLDKLRGITAIAAGVEHSLALDETCGVIWAWGLNDSGQLGDGTTSSVNVPTPVRLGGGVFNDNGLLPVSRSCHLLGVEKRGDGRGTVSEGNGLLECSVDCMRAYARYVRPVVGTATVTLTATATAAPGSRFAGWSEACSAAAASRSATINVTRSTLCVATFEAVLVSQ